MKASTALTYKAATTVSLARCDSLVQRRFSSSRSRHMKLMAEAEEEEKEQAAAAASPLASTTPVHEEDEIVVETSETPNPDSLRFFSMQLSFLENGQSMDFPNSSHAYKSALAEVLFGIEGVSALFFADEYITVTREGGEGADADSWSTITPMVKEAIIAFASGTESIITDEVKASMPKADWDTEPSNDDPEVVLAIKELLATRIRPMVRQDGGNVRFIGFEDEDGLVFVMLEGACKTCPSSGMTLKNGIERMLMHWIPEVTEVQEVDEDFAEDYRLQKKQEIEQKEREEAFKKQKEEEAKKE
jgi:Fe-S cluster biogenesis protein NfuA